MGAAAGSDIYGVCTKNSPEKRDKMTTIIRFAVLISILISYLICHSLGESSDSPIIAISTSLFMGICASAFLPAYFCSLYWKKATKEGAYASMWVGVIVTILLIIFVHAKEAAALGICQALFGKDVIISNGMLKFVDPIVIAFPLSCITIVVVSLLTRKKDENQIQK